jgi:hypothetical protein
MVDTVFSMRQHMLGKTQRGPGNRTDLPDISELDFRMIRYTNSGMPFNDFRPVEGPSHTLTSWKSYVLAKDKSQPIGEMSDTLGDKEPAVERYHTLAIMRSFSAVLYI